MLKPRALNLSQTDAVYAALLGSTQTVEEAARVTGLDPALIDLATLSARLGARLVRCAHCCRWITRRDFRSTTHGCPHCGESYHSKHCRQCGLLINAHHWYCGTCATCGYVNHPSSQLNPPNPNWANNAVSNSPSPAKGPSSGPREMGKGCVADQGGEE